MSATHRQAATGPGSLVGASDTQAAEAAGVARPTVTNWRNHLPAFQEALAEARTDLLGRSFARLHAATSVAVRALEEVAKASTPAPRVAAARAILEFSAKAREQEELEERLAKLEESLAAQKAHQR